MMPKYLIRLDDASPYMDSNNWKRVEDILDNYGVKPLVGVIPANADSNSMKDPEDVRFWDKVRGWKEKGWEIALHGYDHVCISNDGMKGINPFWRRSEYAGLPLSDQKDKIKKGLGVMISNGINPKCFIAPSHTFDNNTLIALKEESDIRIICDTIALSPYKKDGFVFIPQLFGHCVKAPITGLYTFCLHPNTMSERDICKLESFLCQYHQYFTSINEMDLSNVSGLRLIDRLVKFIFFTIRKIKGYK